MYKSTRVQLVFLISAISATAAFCISQVISNDQLIVITRVFAGITGTLFFSLTAQDFVYRKDSKAKHD